MLPIDFEISGINIRKKIVFYKNEEKQHWNSSQK